MQTYFIKRALLLIPTIFLVMILVFVLIRMIPGDAVVLMLQDQNFSTDDADELRAQLGLDKPVPEQFVNYVGDLVSGDLGVSIWTGEGISSELFKRRLPVTLELGLMAVFFSILIGIPIGTISAIRQDSWPDYIGRSLAIGGLSIPGFWLATLAVVLPSIWWGYAPPFKYVPFTEDPIANLKQFWLPAFIMGLSLSAVLMRMTRSMMLEVLRQDYVRTAWSKGLRERTVIFRHALKNALIPVITILGLQFGIIIGGTVIYENIFNLPGIGSYTYSSVVRRDYPVIQSVNIFLATMILLMNFAVDMSYAYLDPRIRLR
jgi:peptide/nickel transport system permease protein